MIEELLSNKALIVSGLSWFMAQTIKAIILTFKQKKFRFDLYSLPGGFPSSHSATVSGLSAAVGLIYGFDSAVFAVSIILAFFIVYDAKVIRGAAGKQAQSLNRLIELVNEEEGEDIEKLKEVLGHSLIEIMWGIILGLLIAILIAG